MRAVDVIACCQGFIQGIQADKAGLLAVMLNVACSCALAIGAYSKNADRAGSTAMLSRLAAKPGLALHIGVLVVDMLLSPDFAFSIT
ncbi:hypothetical protein UNDKW_3879 [Undibacterium sp. KW1]|nr:hypothetical protein UNDKW_3879 [Undibacterium sp. KW1]